MYIIDIQEVNLMEIIGNEIDVRYKLSVWLANNRIKVVTIPIRSDINPGDIVNVTRYPGFNNGKPLETFTKKVWGSSDGKKQITVPKKGAVEPGDVVIVEKLCEVEIREE